MSNHTTKPLHSAPAGASITMAFIGLVIGYSVAAFLYFQKGHIIAPAIIFGISTGVVICALFVPAAYHALHRFFVRVGHKVGILMSLLLLVPLFYLFFVPARVVWAITGNDPLRLRVSRKMKLETYWVARAVETNPESYRKQY